MVASTDGVWRRGISGLNLVPVGVPRRVAPDGALLVDGCYGEAAAAGGHIKRIVEGGRVTADPRSGCIG